jgi:hypothetical protein
MLPPSPRMQRATAAKLRAAQRELTATSTRLHRRLREAYKDHKVSLGRMSILYDRMEQADEQHRADLEQAAERAAKRHRKVLRGWGRSEKSRMFWFLAFEEEERAKKEAEEANTVDLTLGMP